MAKIPGNIRYTRKCQIYQEIPDIPGNIGITSLDCGHLIIWAIRKIGVFSPFSITLSYPF